MSTAQAYATLVTTVGQIKKIDKERLLRGTLGEESLQQSGFAETLEITLQRADFALEYGKDVDDGSINNVNSILNTIRQTLEDQGKRENPEYVCTEKELPHSNSFISGTTAGLLASFCSSSC